MTPQPDQRDSRVPEQLHRALSDAAKAEAEMAAAGIHYDALTFEQRDGQRCALCGRRVPGGLMYPVLAPPGGPSPQLFVHTPRCPDAEISS